MPDIFYLLSKWWKRILAIVLISVAGAALILFLQKPKYLSTATALPASSYLSDKASVFNENIQLLYAATGTPDDLDVIVGTAQVDTVFIALAETMDLASHYKVDEKGKAAILKAASELKGNTRVLKSDFNELKVKVWDEDKNFAADAANAIMNKLESIHSDVQNTKNLTMVRTLRMAIDQQNLDADSSQSNISHARAKLQPEQRQLYEKLLNEYQLMIDTRPQVLIVIDRARAAAWPDKPKKFPILLGTVVLSFFFAVLLAIVLEKTRK